MLLLLVTAARTHLVSRNNHLLLPYKPPHCTVPYIPHHDIILHHEPETTNPSAAPPSPLALGRCLLRNTHPVPSQSSHHGQRGIERYRLVEAGGWSGEVSKQTFEEEQQQQPPLAPRPMHTRLCPQRSIFPWSALHGSPFRVSFQTTTTTIQQQQQLLLLAYYYYYYYYYYFQP